MKRELGWKSLGLAGLLLIMSVNSAWSLTDEEIFRDFRFNFINPGARSLGLGGAFIAAAADATAVEANPAALHYINRFEIFTEFRATRPELQVLNPSRRFGSKDIGSVEDFTRFQSVTNLADTESFSFASFAFPFNLGGQRATLAFSRQLVLDSESSLTADDGRQTNLSVSLVDFPIVVIPGTPPTVERYSVQNTVVGDLDAELLNYNIGFSIAVSQDFSIGVTATMADLTMQSQVDSRTEDPRGVLTSIHPRVNIGGVFSDIQSQTMIDDSDTDVTFSLGLHWHPDTVFSSEAASPLRLGLVYRQGAELAVDERVQEFNPVTMQFEGGEQFENVLRVPDRWGIGAAYITDRWLFSLDIERIFYSDLLQDFRPGENFFTSGRIPPSLLAVDANDLVFDVDDATVVHAGVEYLFSSRGGWQHFVRAGYFNAPDNKIALVQANTPRQNVNDILLDLFRGGTDIDHYTVGFGFNTRLTHSPFGPSLSLQAAADLSDAGDQFVLSGIVRFGGIRR